MNWARVVASSGSVSLAFIVSSVLVLEYKCVVAFNEEQPESVQNGRTLGKSVDFSRVRTHSSPSYRL